jgi:2-polyprenyl-3-methyl-5-hydroxy-6-metoxy-1,4-benzoquinol methylase
MQHSKPPVVVDVGANLGWMMLSAAKMGANVLAFEGEVVINRM